MKLLPEIAQSAKYLTIEVRYDEMCVYMSKAQHLKFNEAVLKLHNEKYLPKILESNELVKNINNETTT